MLCFDGGTVNLVIGHFGHFSFSTVKISLREDVVSIFSHVSVPSWAMLLVVETYMLMGVFLPVDFC